MIPKKLWIPDEFTHLVQSTTFHLAEVKDLKDPDGRGRVKCELPALFGEGEKNWTNWAEPVCAHVSSVHKDGDVGTWWLPTVGQLVMVGFQSGDYDAPIYMPAMPWQEKLEEFSPMIPKEAKKLLTADRRKGTRIRIMKSEAGSSLIFDDNGKQEKVALVDWTGSGLYLVAPGKEEDEQEQDKTESKPRKNSETRETRFVPVGNAKTPGQLLDGGTHILANFDLGGQGMVCLAQDGKGVVALFCTNGVGQIGPSVVLESENKRAYVTAGDVQIQVLGDKGHIAVTRQIILEAEKVPVEDAISAMFSAIGQAFSGLVES